MYQGIMLIIQVRNLSIQYAGEESCFPGYFLQFILKIEKAIALLTHKNLNINIMIEYVTNA
ncbi:hypothetical protein B4096_0434 [Heyndrickxia coagulans]|nr:hypothetical protein B4096_0434 [Heyndrickxia coagulans]